MGYIYFAGKLPPFQKLGNFFKFLFSLTAICALLLLWKDNALELPAALLITASIIGGIAAHFFTKQRKPQLAHFIVLAAGIITLLAIVILMRN